MDGAELHGLSSAEAAQRLAHDGPNRLVPERIGSRWRSVLEPLLDPMVLLLLVAAPTYFAIGDTSDGIVTCIALAPIAGVGWVLEHRTERTLAQLRRLTAPIARVRRDNVDTEVAADTVVRGDLLTVKEGDVVPADARVVELAQLEIDESSLTGESLPVAKATGDVVFGGTTVVSGRALAEVTETGLRTRYGAIGGLLATTTSATTPLQRAVRRMVGVFGIVAAIFCILVVVAELLRGNGWGAALIAGVSLAIAAVPEEFPMVYTLYLALGAWRLSREQALVRRLPGVETLGSTTVICTDKTGTLTHGHLEVVGISPVVPDTERELLETAVLACEVDPFDPLDLAIIGHARAHGIDVDGLRAGRLVADHAFDPGDKYLTHLWETPTGVRRVATKGSIEGVLRHAQLDPTLVEVARSDNDTFARSGMRVIAVAGCTTDLLTHHTRAEHEHNLRYLGIIAFSDTVREGVREALEECHSAGIRVIMITGDHPVTAHAIAEGLSLAHTDASGNDRIATGDDLDEADDHEFSRLVAGTNVFARIRPDQKHRIVRALRGAGEVVAMTGDGVNDAPALREADIGVAMGVRGTAVARSAATMVLLDDNFSTIVTAIRDGRRIFDNLRRAFAYLVAFHVPLLVAALVVPFAGKPLLLLPVHLVLLEIVLHPAVSLVFEADPAAPGTMRRPPTPRTEGLLSGRLWRPFALGVVLSAAVLGTYLVALDRGWAVDTARTTSFCLLLVGQMILLLVERTPDRPIWSGFRPTRTLGWVLATFVLLLVLVTYVRPLADLLRLTSLNGTNWFVAVALAALATLWSEPLKRSRRRPHSVRPVTAPPSQ